MTRQLAGLIGASVPVLEALEVLITTAKNKDLKKILSSIVVDVRNGTTFAQAMAKHPRAFPGYYIAMLEAAELSGELASTFETLANYIERALNSKRAVRSALYYPVVLVVLAIVAVTVLSIVVLPKFVAFFESLNSQLPLATRALLNTIALFNEFWIFIMGGLVLFVLFIALMRRTEAGKYAIDRTILTFPVIGRTVRLVNLERFARMLASLTDAGVPLPDSLALTANSVTNSVYQRAIRKVRLGVLGGQGLTAPMKETGIFPTDTVQILDVGERSGRLVEQLDHAAAFYSKDVDYRLKNMTALIEPVVLVFVGGAVGFVAVALVSAMYGIYSSSGLGS